MTTEESNSQDMERGMLEKHSALQEIQVGHSSIDNAKDQEEVSEKKTVCSKMKDFLVSNFLPITLIIAIVFGALVPQPGVFINHKATSYVCVIGIFLYSGLFLKTDEMISAIKSYRSAGWGCFSILFLTCVIGSELTVLLPFDHRVSERTSNISSNRFVPGLFGHQEFKIGFQVFFIVPCTVSSGVVLVQQLNGNYALAVLLTVFCNMVGIFTVPLLLKWLLASGGNVKFDIGSFLLKMCLTILLPLMVGKALQYISPLKKFVTKHKLPLKLLSIIFLVTLAWMKVSMTSNTGKLQSLSPVNIVLFICWALTIHLLYLIINRIASLVLCLSVKETKCIVILASQKSLAVGIPIIGFLPLALGDQGLMVLPMIMSHLSIIIADSVIVTIWLKWFDVKEKEPNDESKDTLVQTGKDIVGKEDKETRSELGSYPEPVGDAAHEQLT